MSTAESISSNEMKYNKKKNNFYYASDGFVSFVKYKQTSIIGSESSL